MCPACRSCVLSRAKCSIPNRHIPIPNFISILYFRTAEQPCTKLHDANLSKLTIKHLKGTVCKDMQKKKKKKSLFNIYYYILLFYVIKRCMNCFPDSPTRFSLMDMVQRGDQPPVSQSPPYGADTTQCRVADLVAHDFGFEPWRFGLARWVRHNSTTAHRIFR